jgi:hypothetical protein
MQAPTEQYATWAEVEKYLAPEHQSSVDEQILSLAQDLDGTLAMNEPELSGFGYIAGRPISSSSTATVSSTNSLRGGHASQSKDLGEADTSIHGHKRGDSSSAIRVPRSTRPLLNCVLWRIHGESFSSGGLGSFLLVTNDLETMSWAQKFNISVKRLDQLDQAIKREEADYKSRLSLFEKSKSTSKGRNNEAEEQRSRAPTSPRRDTRPSMGHQDDGSNVQNPSSSRTVISPNSFSRGIEPKHPSASDDFIPRGLMDPNSFGRSSYIQKKPKEEDFILKSGTPREASRGKGKLWEP